MYHLDIAPCSWEKGGTSGGLQNDQKFKVSF